jgi:hypothetical protein
LCFAISVLLERFRLKESMALEKCHRLHLFKKQKRDSA